MAESVIRSPQLSGFLDAFSKQAFGRTTSEAVKGDICVACGKPATQFKDVLSKKEFTISGMCQACQDSVFG